MEREEDREGAEGLPPLLLIRLLLLLAGVEVVLLVTAVLDLLYLLD